MEYITLYYISEWVIRVFMLLLVPQRRKPSSALAWLMVIFLQPWVGVVLYMLFGARGVNAKRRKIFHDMSQRAGRLRERLDAHPQVTQPAMSVGALSAASFVQRLGGMPVLGGNEGELFPEAEPFFERLVADINAAQSSVHLLFYIFNDDVVGERIIAALGAAVERGVTCRVLVDAMGSKVLVKKKARQFKKLGIELQSALPVKLMKRLVGRVDMRNHRKIVVIDGVIGYTGSQNMTDPSYGHADLIWHDVMMRLEGPIVWELQALFILDWSMEVEGVPDYEGLFPEFEPSGSATLQLLPSGPTYEQENYQRLIVAVLYHAAERVVITTPYLVPDEPFMQAVQVACMRGVEVVIIAPHKTDQVLPTQAAQSYYEELLGYGVKLYLHQDGLLHSKTMTIDGKLALFGSSNFDVRSFAINFEVNLVIYDADLSRKVTELQNRYITESKILTAEEWATSRSRAAKLLQNVARLMSPML